MIFFAIQTTEFHKQLRIIIDHRLKSFCERFPSVLIFFKLLFYFEIFVLETRDEMCYDIN